MIIVSNEESKTADKNNLISEEKEEAGKQTNISISRSYVLNTERLLGVEIIDFVLNTSTTLPEITDIEQTKQIKKGENQNGTGTDIFCTNVYIELYTNIF